jgi:hypothetical protein
LTQADTREKRPLRTGKYFFKPVTSTNGVVDSIMRHDEFLDWDEAFSRNKIESQTLSPYAL